MFFETLSMGWRKLPTIPCSCLAGFSTKDALTVSGTVNCLLMVVWCCFFARLQLRLSLVSLQINTAVTKNMKRNGK